MQLVAIHCFEPARNHFDCPLYLSSFFRSEELNDEIGGSDSSQHCAGRETGLKESAIDIDQDHRNGPTNRDVFFWLKDNVEFDQLIWEFGDDPNAEPDEDGNEPNPGWVHIGYRAGANRKQVLIAYRVPHPTRPGRTKTKYRVYDGPQEG